MTEHEKHMSSAIEMAQRAAELGEVPVGAALVIDGEVIARGHNRRRETSDPTAHAEVETLRLAGQRLGDWRVEGDLYVTQEPCPMCAGAIVNARVRRLFFGCMNPKAGAVQTLYEIPTDVRLNHRVEVVGGVREQECGDIMRSFFRALRQDSQGD